MNNNDNKIIEHIAKERIKQLIDSNFNYTEKQKYELKLIVNSGKTPEEVICGILTYFSFGG